MVAYLVGKIVEVNYLSSRILLLSDLNSKIPVYSIEPNQEIFNQYYLEQVKIMGLFNIVKNMKIFKVGLISLYIRLARRDYLKQEFQLVK